MSVLDIFWKSRSEEIMPLDLSWMGSDMHSHLIPGIDDGSQSMEESVILIKRLRFQMMTLKL